MPHFDYCSPVWDCLSGYLSDKLQKLQNRAARVITKWPFDTSSNYPLSTLYWERLFLRRKKQKALTMFKTMNGLAPHYLQSLFSQHHSIYNLRDSEGTLILPKPSTNYLKRSFSYSGAMLWNNLPKRLKTAVSVDNFKHIISNMPSKSHVILIIINISCQVSEKLPDVYIEIWLTFIQQLNLYPMNSLYWTPKVTLTLQKVLLFVNLTNLKVINNENVKHESWVAVKNSRAFEWFSQWHLIGWEWS